MTWAPGGGSLDIRSLAGAVGVSKSKIHALLSGERPSVTQEVAERICEVLDVRRDALFLERLPTPMGVGSPRTEGDGRGHERAHDAAPTRGTHQLGEDQGQVEPHRSRPAR
ncbi:helix-turn-helix domain-containing protein [Streptomyces ambofaciens]